MYGFLLNTHDWYIKKTNKQSVVECSDIGGKKNLRRSLQM